MGEGSRLFLGVLPLVLGAFAFPLALFLAALLDVEPDLLVLRVLWAGLACAGFVFQARGGGRPGAWRFPLWIAVGVCLCAALWLAPLIMRMASGLGMLFNGLSPIIYGLFAFVWARSFGPPGESGLVCCGTVFSLVVLAAAAAGWFLPGVEVFADQKGVFGVLALGFFAAGLSGWGTWTRWLPLAAMAALGFHPGLAAGGMMILVFGPGRWWSRILGAMGVCLLAVAAPLPDAVASGHWYEDTYRAWLTTAALMLSDPGAMLAGFPLDRSLPLKGSETLRALLFYSDLPVQWAGVLPQQVRMFWPRLALGWGLVAVAGVLLGGLVCIVARPVRDNAALITALVLGGVFTPLFYSDAAGPLLFLMLMKTMGGQPGKGRPGSTGPDFVFEN